MTISRLNEIKERLWSTWETDDIGSDEYESLRKELERLAEDSKDPECLFALSELYIHKANGCRRAAARYALRGLEIDPCHSGLHDGYNIANNGGGADFKRWCHHGIIEHYYRFIGDHPSCFIARRILIENLIDNNRMDEAKREIQSARKVAGENEFFLEFYQGEVLQRVGRGGEAAQIWERVVEQNQKDSRCLFMNAEVHAKIGEYRIAKEYYRRSFGLQQKPRKIDALISILQILEIEKAFKEAIAVVDEILDVYKTDYDVSGGPEVQPYLDRRQRLQRLASRQ